MLAKDKDSSLLRTLINYGRKKIYKVDTRTAMMPPAREKSPTMAMAMMTKTTPMQAWSPRFETLFSSSTMETSQISYNVCPWKKFQTILRARQ
jgi:hypothetical protein